MKSGHVDSGDQKIYYEVDGVGEPLLLIMGLSGDILAWANQITILKQHFTVIAVDNRDAGRSGAGTDGYAIADMAGDALAVLDALEVNAAHVLGFSMGGMIAQELALNHPARVKKLILYATSSGLATAHASVFDPWEWVVHNDAEGDVLAKFVLSMVMTENFLRDEAMVTQAMALRKAHPYPQSPDSFSRQASAVRGFDASERFTNISAQTLVLVGERDVLVPPWHSGELAAGIPGARLETLEGGGHGMFMEVPDRFTDVVVGFLTET